MQDRVGVFVENDARRLVLSAHPLFSHPNGIYKCLIVEVSIATYITPRFQEWMRDELLTRLAHDGTVNLMVKP